MSDNPEKISSFEPEPGRRCFIRSSNATRIVELTMGDGTIVRTVLPINGVVKVVEGNRPFRVDIYPFTSMEEAFPDLNEEEIIDESSPD